MKVVHIESGLGNQMLSFCEYLALKAENPNDDIYIENIIYDIPECNESIRQWNGYELETVFGVNAPNIKSVFSEVQWLNIISKIRESKFWILKEHNWNYPVYFTKAFKTEGLNIINFRGDFEDPQKMLKEQNIKGTFKYRLMQTLPLLYLRAWKVRQPIKEKLLFCQNELFIKSDQNIFTGQKLLFKYKGSGIERIESDIRKTFVFPNTMDEKNKLTFNFIKNKNSIAIHARRSDMLESNKMYYVSGYFKRAVKFIRKNVGENPIFFIFCDPDSIQWAKENEKTLGLNMKYDEVHFIDWNKDDKSYIDMQLMSACKHQIITNSSFGWWGAWLNNNPNKITCSPDFRINTTHTF